VALRGWDGGVRWQPDRPQTAAARVDADPKSNGPGRISAHALGNHEFNAIAYAQWNDERSGYRQSRLGESGKTHLDQHAAFID
jgi:hypothetical protein